MANHSDQAFIGQYLWDKVGCKPAFTATKNPCAIVVCKNEGFDSETMGIFARIGEECYFVDKQLLSNLPVYSFGDGTANKVFMSCELKVPPEVSLELVRRAEKKNAALVRKQGTTKKQPKSKVCDPKMDTQTRGEIAEKEPLTKNCEQVTDNMAQEVPNTEATEQEKVKHTTGNRKRKGKRMCLTDDEFQHIIEERKKQMQERAASYEKTIDRVAKGLDLRAESYEDTIDRVARGLDLKQGEDSSAETDTTRHIKKEIVA